ncbi:glycosyltransferase family 2 protein [Haloarcula sp. 1CSR25-25]|uniref:glycosyltransferase family 2 protein n=1 Tax=Haloarcula sp. 1CSR25-25 TaxID=2862545 RepID=UPI0028945125|nr:glycosyltransferase family 2 protein [Haloarcula sp. 1CSR25-25]MDT3435565.1 glycosyltransferase family 2 protein [Haloarcula sp. 1CSR25-25]
MTDDPHVVAVVLNWNNYEDSSRCLESLIDQDYSNLDIILVDNASTDGSGEQLNGDFFDITVIYTKENLGFAGGMNYGIRAAMEESPDYVWILNNDSILPKKTLEGLVPILEYDSDIGILSPRIQTENEELWFLQGAINWRKCDVDHQVPDNNSAESQLISNEYIPMCAALIRSEVFEQIGLLPEDYFMYYEDVDFCIKTRRKGYRLATSTTTTITHIGSASSGSDLSALPTYYNFRNRIHLARTYSDQSGSGFWIYYVMSILYGTLRRFYNKEFEAVVPLLRGVADGIQETKGRGPYP